MSLIDRNLYSSHVILDEEYEDDYHLHDSNRDSDLAHQISPQELENINQIRKLIRDQSFLGLNTSKTNIVGSRNEYRESLDDLEVPVRRFTPLPGIPRFEDPYYRTKSQLIKHEIDNDDIPINSTYSSLKRSLTMNESKYSLCAHASKTSHAGARLVCRLFFINAHLACYINRRGLYVVGPHTLNRYFFCHVLFSYSKYCRKLVRKNGLFAMLPTVQTIQTKWRICWKFVYMFALYSIRKNSSHIYSSKRSSRRCTTGSEQSAVPVCKKRPQTTQTNSQLRYLSFFITDREDCALFSTLKGCTFDVCDGNVYAFFTQERINIGEALYSLSGIKLRQVSGSTEQLRRYEYIPYEYILARLPSNTRRNNSIYRYMYKLFYKNAMRCP